MSFAKGTILSILSALIIGAAAWVSVPIGIVPITMQLITIFVIGLVLSAPYSVLSVAFYIVFGLFGVPIFAGGKAGYNVLVGATGGYLIGYFVSVIIISSLTKKVRNDYLNDVPEKNYALILCAFVLGAAIILGFGVMWGKISTGLEWDVIVDSWLLPFLPGLPIKMVVAVFISVPILKTKFTIT